MKRLSRLILSIALLLNAALLAAQTEAMALMLNAVAQTAQQPEAVDMGLSVKWASCNLGATSPEGFGDYFAWAETATKDNYDWSSYSFCGDAPYGMTKYNAGFMLNLQAEAVDDAAAQTLGDGWRMPTFVEMTELVNNTKWEWGALNGVAGYTVTSNINGNGIFLPAAGYKEGGEMHYAGTAGRYWTLTRHPYHPKCAMELFFSPEFHYAYFYRRYRGYPIRPVHL